MKTMKRKMKGLDKLFVALVGSAMVWTALPAVAEAGWNNHNETLVRDTQK